MVKFGDEIKSGPIPAEVESFVDNSGDRAQRTLLGGWEIRRIDEPSWRPYGGEEIEGWVQWPIMVTGVKEPKRNTISLPKVPDGMDLIGRRGTRYVRTGPGNRWWTYGDDGARIALAHILFDDGPLEVVPALPPAPTLEDDIANVRSDLPIGGSTRDAFDRIINQLNAFRDN